MAHKPVQRQSQRHPITTTQLHSTRKSLNISQIAPEVTAFVARGRDSSRAVYRPRNANNQDASGVGCRGGVSAACGGVSGFGLSPLHCRLVVVVGVDDVVRGNGWFARYRVPERCIRSNVPCGATKKPLRKGSQGTKWYRGWGVMLVRGAAVGTARDCCRALLCTAV